MKNLKQNLLIINIILILFSILIAISGIYRAVLTREFPYLHIFLNIIILTLIIFYLIKFDKIGYILCLINGYFLMALKIFLFAVAPDILTSELGTIIIIDTILLIIYLVLAHVGLVMQKKLET
ncbi:hypothetical protein ACFL1H_05300 [Nanoarchaeota archaeon]